MSEDRPIYFPDWVRANYKDEDLKSILDHQDRLGFSRYITFSDIDLYDVYHSQMWEIINNHIVSTANTLEFLSATNGASRVKSKKDFERLIVWVSLVIVAKEILSCISPLT